MLIHQLWYMSEHQCERKGHNSIIEPQEIKSVNSKGSQPWVFIERTDDESEAPILWPPNVKNWLIRKDPDAGRDWGQEKKGMTEEEMVGWHHQLNGHEFEQTPGVGDGQGGLACCSLWIAKSQTQLSDWTKLNWKFPKVSQHPQEGKLWWGGGWR